MLQNLWLFSSVKKLREKEGEYVVCLYLSFDSE